MSDAGGEYKSDAFMKSLKDARITVLQSAPHTPQQNGHAERFMHTICYITAGCSVLNVSGAEKGH